MSRRRPGNPNRPPRGSSIKVEPIRDLEAVGRIKVMLADAPRDYCLFVTGINSAYRASELLSITVRHAEALRPGDRFELKQAKNSKYRAITINNNVADAMGRCLDWHPTGEADAPLFWSRKSRTALCVPSLTRLVKCWCAELGLRGNYGSHTLRKTWGYHQRKTYDKPLSLLTRAYGHASEAQTLEYLCIQPEEFDELYAGEL